MGEFSIINVPQNTTKIFPCREGDVFLWVQDKASLISLEVDLQIADLWVTGISDTVLFTNRLEDVPKWLPLPPEAVGGRNVHMMVKKLNEGFKLDQYRVDDSEEYWKLDLHHYVIWLGEKRNDCEYNNGVLAILQPAAGSLAVLQKNDLNINALTGDSLDDYHSHLTDEKAMEARLALEFLGDVGKSRRFAQKWTLG